MHEGLSCVSCKGVQYVHLNAKEERGRKKEGEERGKEREITRVNTRACAYVEVCTGSHMYVHKRACVSVRERPCLAACAQLQFL